MATWDELKESGAILQKGQRKSRPVKEKSAEAKELTGMRCSNCGGAFNYRAPDRCRCSIWEVGKVKR